MALATWGADWPLTSKVKSVSRHAAFIRTPFEAGTGRNRRWFTAVPSYYDATVTFNTEQAGEFEDWFEDTIGFGSDPFTLTVEMGDGFKQRIVQFREPPSFEQVGPSLFKYNLPLIIMPTDPS